MDHFGHPGPDGPDFLGRLGGKIQNRPKSSEPILTHMERDSKKISITRSLQCKVHDHTKIKQKADHVHSAGGGRIN